LSKYLSAAFRYFKEFALSIVFFIAISALLNFFNADPIFYLFNGVATLSLLFFSMGKKRSNDLSNIKATLRQITAEETDLTSEFKLDDGLEDIQVELNAMVSKIQSDFVYLKKLEQIRKEFLGNVSHELKTPIFAITGYLETLLNGAISDPKVNMHFLQKAYDHTENLSNLLNDLIDISLIESGQMRMSFRYFYLKMFINDLAEDFELAFQDRNIELIVHPIRKGLQIYSDKSRLRQVMANLLQNALKYTTEGKIEIMVNEHSDDCTILVRDSGVGIPKEDLPRIFERFYRVDKARSRDVGGTGLGLAIVKHILEAHDSKIEVRSEYGEGSVFFFNLKK
jgi:two-component system phosphate regulon sensor histidine kinase PhoR